MATITKTVEVIPSITNTVPMEDLAANAMTTLSTVCRQIVHSVSHNRHSVIMRVTFGSAAEIEQTKRDVLRSLHTSADIVIR